MHYTDTLLHNLRLCGVSVIEIDGWRTRGSATFTPAGSTNHHTAGSPRGSAPSLGVCINGRADLPGPLCNGLLGRDLVLRLIAAGRANHAGRGGFRGLSGNSKVFGLEVEHCGVAAREPVSPELVDVSARVHAAFCLTGSYSADMVHQHWEWAPTRKIDFVKGTVNPNEFRRLVQHHIDHSTAPSPAPTPPQATEEDLTMGATEDIVAAVNQTKPFAARMSNDGGGARRGEVWIITPAGRYHIDRPALDGLYFMGSIRHDDGNQPAMFRASQFASIPIIQGAPS